MENGRSTHTSLGIGTLPPKSPMAPPRPPATVTKGQFDNGTATIVGNSPAAGGPTPPAVILSAASSTQANGNVRITGGASGGAQYVSMHHAAEETRAATRCFIQNCGCATEDITRVKEKVEWLYLSGWSAIEVHQLVAQWAKSTISKNDISQLSRVLDIISNYHLPYTFGPPASERDNVRDIIQKNEFSAIYPLLHEYAIAIGHTTEEPDVDDIVTQLKELNEHFRTDFISGDSTTFDIVKEQYITYLGAMGKHSEILLSNEKAIRNWQEEDIKHWAKFVRKQPRQIAHKLPEVVAVMVRGVELTATHRVRKVQVLSLLLLAQNQPNKGRIAQVNTGEGKSLIIAMLAVLQVLKGKKVDVITTSEVLAMREVGDKASRRTGERKSFYELFCCTVSHNINPVWTPGKVAVCYEADVVYGTANSFQGDVLHHEYSLLEMRGNRRFAESCAIIDEVDSMFVDEFAHSTYLTSSQPGFKKLNIVLIRIWHELCALKKDEKITVMPNGSRIVTVQDQDGEAHIQLLPDRLKAIAKIAIDNVKLPPHLVKYAEEGALDTWVENAINVAYDAYRLDVHYAVRGNEIVVVDHANTGVVHQRMQFSGGLHQFLQLRANLPMSPIRLITNYCSNVGFLERYGCALYGLTGTLGKPEVRTMLHTQYPIDSVIIPPHKPSNRVDFPDIVLDSPKKWLTEIIGSICNEVAHRGRAALVICESIADVRLVKGALEGQYDASKIFEYARNDDPAQAKVIHRTVDIGDVILATNLAGRGADIRTTPAVDARGGLHVCVTFLPKNSRVEAQAKGRTARAGKHGSAQLIIRVKSAYKPQRLREAAEQRFLSSTETTIKKIRQKDILFKKFVELRDIGLKELNISTNTEVDNAVSRGATAAVGKISDTALALRRINNPLDEQTTIAALEERWGMWLSAMSDKADIEAEFVRFSHQIREEFAADELIKNPTYYNQKVANKLGKWNSAWWKEGDNLEHALKFCDKSIALDKNSFIPHLYKAFILGKKDDSDYAGVKECLEAARFLLASEWADVLAMYSIAEHKAPIVYSRIYEAIYVRIEADIAALDEAKGHGRGLVVRPITLDSLCKEEGLAQAIAELKGLGVEFVPGIKERVATWKIVGVAALGVIEIAAGVALLVSAQPWALALIGEGMGDLFVAGRMHWTGEFDLKTFLCMKILSIGFSAAAAGVAARAAKPVITSMANVVVAAGVQEGVERTATQIALDTANKLLTSETMRTVTQSSAYKAIQLIIPSLKVLVSHSTDTITEEIKQAAIAQLNTALEDALRNNRDAIAKLEESVKAIQEATREAINARIKDNVKNPEFKRGMEAIYLKSDQDYRAKLSLLKELAAKSQVPRVLDNIIPEKISVKGSIIELADVVAANTAALKTASVEATDSVSNALASAIKQDVNSAATVDQLLADLKGKCKKALDVLITRQYAPSGSVETKDASSYAARWAIYCDKFVSEMLVHLDINSSDQIQSKITSNKVDLDTIETIGKNVAETLGIEVAACDTSTTKIAIRANQIIIDSFKAQIKQYVERYDEVINIPSGIIDQVMSTIGTRLDGIMLEQLEASLAPSLEQLNAFNMADCLDEDRYEYQGSDMGAISRQLLAKYDYAQLVQPVDIWNLRSVVMPADLSKGPIAVFCCLGEGAGENPRGHWVCFTISKAEEDRVLVLYKDSMGGLDDAVTTTLRNIYGVDKIDFRVNRKHEQTDSKSCGIFALKNMDIILSNFQTTTFKDTFAEFGNFCAQNDADKLRSRLFPEYYINDTILLITQDAAHNAARIGIFAHHKAELDDFITPLAELATKLDQVLCFEVVQDVPEDIAENTVYLSMDIEPFNDIEPHNYRYSYRLSWHTIPSNFVNAIRELGEVSGSKKYYMSIPVSNISALYGTRAVVPHLTKKLFDTLLIQGSQQCITSMTPDSLKERVNINSQNAVRIEIIRSAIKDVTRDYKAVFKAYARDPSWENLDDTLDDIGKIRQILHMHSLRISN